jgi:hydroxypyruvate reductase
MQRLPEAEAAAVEAMVQRAGAGYLVLALISGGGSAMLPAPIDGVTRVDKAQANRVMLGGGLDITRMNAVRQHVSRLKGGGLARMAAPAQVVALILSDVIGDDLRVIASGPTVAPIVPRADAVAILRDAGLWAAMPESVCAALERVEPEPLVPMADNRLIGSNALSVQAMAAAVPGAEIWSEALEGDVAEAARFVAARIRAARPGARVALCGGETTVVLKGTGLGGRNQEMALRVAAELQGFERPWVMLSGGTDGLDGPTEAAGGIVDGDTLARIAAAGGDWRALLANNDSHAALARAGDLLMTGGTGTNVADVQVIVLG